MLDNLAKIAAQISLDNKQLVMILGMLCGIDILTGIMNAALEGEIRSAKMRTGLTKKAYEFLLVGCAAVLDAFLNVNFICIATLVWFSIEECISILENTGKYLPIPEFLKKAIGQLRNLYKEDKE